MADTNRPRVTEGWTADASDDDPYDDDLFDMIPAPPRAMRVDPLQPLGSPVPAPPLPASPSPTAAPLGPLTPLGSTSEGGEAQDLVEGAPGEGSPTTWRSSSKPPSQRDVGGKPRAIEPRTTTLRPPPTTPRGAAPPPAATAEAIKTQIHELEAHLDGLIQQSREGRRTGAPPARESSPPDLARGQADPSAESVAAKEIFSTDFYRRRWGRAGARARAEEVDEFGLDPRYEALYRPFFDFLYKHYFRVDTQGFMNIPSEGRCLVVSNHSGGALPYDGVMLRTTLRNEHPSGRELRWLSEDFIYHLPFVGAAMSRLGAVRACQENAERLLAKERLVAVFPEGAKGTGKLYRDRYRLQRFGRGGFIRLCLRTRTPLVPCAIVGAEEANPMLYRIEHLTKALGVPYVPITPTFPALGPLGLLPAPTKWKIRFGELVRFDEYGREAADDDILVSRLSDHVRGAIQALLDKALSERRSIWFG